MPKVSVLMPVYNTKEEWLREAIESILNQTFTDFEFIIINDGSTNNVEDVILSYQDIRIKYVKQNNQGIARTLNSGIDIAQGEYIARMDADDISLPERLEKQVKYMNENSAISILGTWFEIFPETNIIKHPEKPKILDLLKGCVIAHPTVMIRKEEFLKYNLKYDSNFKCEDYELWSRAIKYLNFDNIQEVLLKYRWHADNLSKPTEEFVSSVEKVQKQILNSLTNDIKLQQNIRDVLYYDYNSVPKYTFWEKLFSVKNSKIGGKKYKIITILYMQIKKAMR